MTNPYDIAVVGAGAAGLTAGIFAGEAARAAGRPARVVLLDGAKSVGAKILVAGGGRCNVTHDAVSVTDYNGSKNIVRNVLAAFDERACARWFESMGVALKREETGKLFPVSDSAKTVLAALLKQCGEVGAEVRAGHRVLDITPPPPSAETDGEFLVRHEHGELRAGRVIVATGGRSLPKTGSDGAFYSVLKQLGHTVTETHPALAPLVLDDSFFHATLSGLAHEAELTTLSDGKPIDRRTGSLLWTHFGLSGPVVMDASRHWIVSRAQGKTTELRCASLPGRGFEAVERELVERGVARPKLSMNSVLNEWFPGRMAGVLLRHVGIDAGTPAGQLGREQRRKLVHALTGLVLPVARDRGWNYAEVTAGGVPLPEIDFRTMQSRKVPGLYLVGEVLDCDGRIGGFNFQWAWATGYLAGKAASEE